MTPKKLFRVRVALVQAMLQDHGLDGILLSRVDNFAAVTGGRRNYINAYTDIGANSLAVMKDGRAYYVGNNIERARIEDEELHDVDAGIDYFLWTESTPAQWVQDHLPGKWASDDGSLGQNLHGALALARTLLTDVELERYRRLGRLAAEAMTETLSQITMGTTEADIAAMLVSAGHKRHCHVPVFLVAADDRIAKYRHPLPTVEGLLGEGRSLPVQRYVMVVGCFLREGLVVSLTRFKQVEELPEGVAERFARVCAVDALAQEATRPGKNLAQVFAAIQQGYAAHGFGATEWHNHHQGGATGYAGRTAKGTPASNFPCLDGSLPIRVSEMVDEQVQFGCAFAWNPSGPGVKSEDTFLLLPDGTREIITTTPELPQVDLTRVLGRATEVVKSGIAV
jgi:Xaa-Pro dipeptidase